MSITEKIHKRMEQAENLRHENIEQLKRLNKMAPSMLNKLGAEITKTAGKVETKPNDKKLAKEYSGLVIARNMVRHGQTLAESLLEDEEG